MTREEAIKILQKRQRFCKVISDHANATIKADELQEVEAIDMAISTLRPVSREMVEKVFPGCKHCTKQKVPFCNDGASDSVYLLTGNGLAAIESDSWEFLVSYCPNCGRPLTDEAVEIRLKKLEALYGDR